MQGCIVPHLIDLNFNYCEEALNVKARKFSRDFRMEDKGEEHAIFDGTEQVGSLWYDMADHIRLEDCNCIVVSIVRDKRKLDYWKTYHVLVIRERAEGGGYQRVGAGKVEV